MKFLIRFSLLSSLITPALIAASCSHLSKNEDMLDGKQETLLLAYIKAQEIEATDATGSCSLYSRLAGETFPLKNLSLLKAHLICTDISGLEKIDETDLEKSNYLSHIALQLEEKKAVADKNDFALAQVYFRKSQLFSNLKEKVDFLQKAIGIMSPIMNNRPLTESDQAMMDSFHNRLTQLAPRFLEHPMKKDLFRVGNDWIFAREFKKGREFLKQILVSSNNTPEEKYLAFRSIRNSFKTEQKKDAHIAEAAKFTHWIEKEIQAGNSGFTYQRLNESAMIWARAAWTAGNIKDAKEILNTYEKKLQGRWPLDELYFIRARMSEEIRDYDQALVWLEKAFKESRPKTSYRDRILFSQAWLERKKGNYAQSVMALEKLKAETQDPFDKNRYSFWLGKSLAQNNEAAKAEAELTELTAADPVGYYGLIAYRELKKDLPALSDKVSLQTSYIKQPNEISRDDFELIRALSYVQENEILEKLLDQKTMDLKNVGEKNSSAHLQNLWLYYLKSYARAGLYNPLFQKFGALDVEIKTKFLAEHPDLLFPRRFLPLIESASQKFNVKAELILSIIRQESAFNPMARSGADALGLMQVIPSVAQAHQKWTDVEVKDYHDLFEPEKNIPVGASVLEKLNKKYHGQFVLTVAAYNANDKAIQSWLKTRMSDDPLEFIEDVPYEETRAYIKLVLRNFIFYSRMSQPSASMQFPNWCLEGLQSFKISTN